MGCSNAACQKIRKQDWQNKSVFTVASEITIAVFLWCVSFLISISQVTLHASSVIWCCERFTRTYPEMSNFQLYFFLWATLPSEKSEYVLQAHLSPCLTVCFKGLQTTTQLSSSVTLGFYVHLPLTAGKGARAPYCVGSQTLEPARKGRSGRKICCIVIVKLRYFYIEGQERKINSPSKFVQS